MNKIAISAILQGEGLMRRSSGGSSAEDYAEHVLNGPLSDADVARHLHLLAALDKLEAAMDEVAKHTPQEYRGPIDGHRSALRPIIQKMSVPYALIAEPVKRKIKRLG